MKTPDDFHFSCVRLHSLGSPSSLRVCLSHSTQSATRRGEWLGFWIVIIGKVGGRCINFTPHERLTMIQLNLIDGIVGTCGDEMGRCHGLAGAVFTFYFAFFFPPARGGPTAEHRPFEDKNSSL